MDKCGECYHFEEIEAAKPLNDVVRGMCHRNPPIATGSFLPNVNRITGEMTPQLMETTIWPNVSAEGWCGEFYDGPEDLSGEIEEAKKRLKEGIPNMGL